MNASNQETPLPYGDYVMTDSTVWISVAGRTVYIATGPDGGVRVEIYSQSHEDAEPLAVAVVNQD